MYPNGAQDVLLNLVRTPQHGNVEATINLTKFLPDGSTGLPMDRVRAKQLYEHAPGYGNVIAINNFGELGYKGSAYIVKDHVEGKEIMDTRIGGRQFCISSLLRLDFLQLWQVCIEERQRGTEALL